MAERKMVEEIKASTLLFIAVLSALMTVICNFFIFWLPAIASCTQNAGDLIPTPGVDLMGWPFVMILLIMVLSRIPAINKYLTRANIAYLYVTALAVSYFSSFDMPWGAGLSPILASLITSERTLQYVPEFITPPREVAQILVEGTGSITAIPWDALFPTVIWYFLLVALFGGMSIGVASIFRREWVDVELLPFPQVTIAYSSMASLENLGKPEWPGKTTFIIGFLLGIVTAIPVSGVALFPWFPDIYSWRSNTCGPGCHWIAPPDVPWHLGIAKHAPLYALLLLVPVHYLFSIVFYVLVMEIAFFAAFYTGSYTGFLDIGFCGRHWCYPTPYSDPPLNLGAVNVGLTLGLFVITIIHSKGYIAETLKMAFGGSKDKTVEANEPLSYRTAWLILILSFVALMGLFMYSGTSPWVAFVLTLVGLVTWFTMM